MFNEKLEYFAAANTSKGFICDFPEIFAPEKFKRVYILKGGPGTGKSTLLSHVADAAVRRGLAVEYYLCSSDPSSLDGIIIPGINTALIDGTAPHATDAKYPGAVERVVNLCDCFDSAALEKLRNEITTLSKEQSKHQKFASECLCKSGELYAMRLGIFKGAVKQEKMRAAVKRLIKKATPGKGAAVYRRVSAFSTNGEVYLDTLCKRAEKGMTVGDPYGLAPLFLNDVISELSSIGVPFEYGCGVLLPDYPECVLIPSLSLCISSGDTGKDEYINPARFIDAERMRAARNKLRFLYTAAGQLREKALSELAEVKYCHSRLEKIYSSHVNFSLIDGITEKIIGELGL